VSGKPGKLQNVDDLDGRAFGPVGKFSEAAAEVFAKRAAVALGPDGDWAERGVLTTWDVAK
jgi:hypothetical protein